MRKKSVKKLNKKRCFLVFIILLIAFILLLSFGKNKEKPELSILFNNKIIETNKKVIIEENDIYFSLEDIKNFFDETIYYNQAEKELITTYNNHIALLKIDEKNALINDNSVEIQGNLREVEEIVYLPITDLKEVYDIELEFSQKNNRIIIDSILNQKIEADVIKKVNVKNKKGLFSSKLEHLIIGDNVVVLEETGKYKKIRTKNGNIGFVKTKRLSDEEIVRQDYKEEAKKVLEVYKNYSNISGVYENLQVDESKLNVVIPTFFYIDKNNKVLDKTTSKTATYAVYTNWADTNKLQILPTLVDNESVSNSLLSYSQRSQIATSLVSLLQEHNYMGVNIHLDTIDDLNSFYRFIIELSPRMKAANLKLAVTLENNIDRKRIEQIVDYIIEE